MKKAIFTLILVVSSFAFAVAQTTTTTTVSNTIPSIKLSGIPVTRCFDDAKIKTSAKCFYISYAFTDVSGKYQKGTIGYTCASGTPDMVKIKKDIAFKNNIAIAKVVIKDRAAICQAEFDEIFRTILKGTASVNDMVVFNQ